MIPSPLPTRPTFSTKSKKTAPLANPSPLPTPGKSSLTVSLVLVGSAGLVGCGSNNHQSTRYDYASRDDCVLDWGETECPPSSYGGHGGSYIYYRSGGYDRSKVTHAKHVTRGGFGSKTSSARGG